MSNVSLIVQTVQVGGTLIIGACVAYVAWQQWRTARRKLILDLFDRRLSVYRRILDAVNGMAASNDSTTSRALYGQMLDAKIEARFLFDDSVVGIINRIDELGWKHRVFYDLRDDTQTFTPDERAEMVGNLATDLGKQGLEMINLTEQLGAALKPYLRMTDRC